MASTPRYLYRYMTFDGAERQQYVKEILLDTALYFASRTDFNDPMDSTASVLFNSSSQERLAQLARIASRPRLILDPRVELLRQSPDTDWLDDPRVTAGMVQRLRRAVDRLGMVSLSSNPRSVLLWSHYAAKHKGICLKFRTDLRGDLFEGAQQICYEPNLPVFNAVQDPVMQQVQKLLLTKGRAWRYESEWRLVNTKRRGHIPYVPESLAGVVFGWKMPARDRRLIIDWLDARAVAVRTYSCQPAPSNGFRLTLRPIN